MPASGFGQAAGRAGFRTTFLPPEAQLRTAVSRFAEHHAAFSSWSTDLGNALSSVLTPELRERGEAAAIALSDAVRDLLSERRRRPADDLLSDLMRRLWDKYTGTP